MTEEQLKHIKAYIKKYTDSNIPVSYTTEKDDDNYVYIFGEYFGIVLIPEIDGQISFIYLVEDDGFWFTKDNNNYTDSYWIPDIIKCLNVAQEYLKLSQIKLYKIL